MCKIAIRNACMKQDDIARVLNMSQSVVSKPLKEHRESGSITKNETVYIDSWVQGIVTEALSDDHLIQLKVVIGTLNAKMYQNKGVRSPLDSLGGQNMVLRDDIASPHCTRIIKEYKINRTSLVFHGRACCRTWTLWNTRETSSADVF